MSDATIGRIVRRADPLAEIAQRDDLIYIAIPRAQARAFHNWTSVEFRITEDSRHTRLRRLSVKPYGTTEPRRKRPRKNGRHDQKRSTPIEAESLNK